MCFILPFYDCFQRGTLLGQHLIRVLFSLPESFAAESCGLSERVQQQRAHAALPQVRLFLFLLILRQAAPSKALHALHHTLSLIT